MQIEQILKKVEKGELTAREALAQLAGEKEANLGFARVDVERPRRRGMPEVIYAEGKTADQVIQIVRALRAAKQAVLCTRSSPELFDAVSRVYPEARYHDAARLITMGDEPDSKKIGLVAVVCAGTSDIPVAEEAAISAEWAGARVERIYDVGVAGLHRVVNHLDYTAVSRAHPVVAIGRSPVRIAIKPEDKQQGKEQRRRNGRREEPAAGYHKQKSPYSRHPVARDTHGLAFVVVGRVGP